ncbi:hypothetical protein PtA15_4A199 [Puccinia triticina]|nr:uncharacterized protein PtA15_4A199 [Puccinia triticina]WAQ83751.1 hypothetical protein PtA15_4A199 [Puccinia triticina]
MHPGFPENPRASFDFWSTPAYAESEYVPEGYSIVHTAQPGFYTRRTRNPCPLTSADAYQYQYHPVTLHAKHLVPIAQSRLAHQNMLYLQHRAILTETSEHLEEIFQREIKERDDKRTAAKIRKEKSQQEVSARVKAFSKPMVSDGVSGGFSWQPQSAKLPVRIRSIQPVISPSGLTVHEERRRLLANKDLITPTVEFHQEEPENQAHPKVPKISDARENLDPSSFTAAEDSAKQFEEKDDSRDLSTPLNEKTEDSSPGFPSNEIGGSAHDPAGLRTSVHLPTFGKVEDLENEKLAGSNIKITHHPVSGETVVPVNEAATSLSKTQAATKRELTPPKTDIASGNQDEVFLPADTFSVQTSQLQQSLPYESENNLAMSIRNKAPESTYKYALLKEENVPLSVEEFAGVEMQKKKYIPGSQGPHRAPNPHCVTPNARANANDLTAVKQRQSLNTKSTQKPHSDQAKATPSPKSPETLRSIDATNPSEQVENSKTSEEDPSFSSGPRTVGDGTEDSAWRTHGKTNKV